MSSGSWDEPFGVPVDHIRPSGDESSLRLDDEHERVSPARTCKNLKWRQVGPRLRRPTMTGRNGVMKTTMQGRNS